MQLKRPTIGDWYSFIVVVGLTATGMWAHLDQMGGPYVVLIFALCAGALAVAKPLAERPALILAEAKKKKKSELAEIKTVDFEFWSICLLLVSPVLAYWILTWQWEFPLSGDHDHHLAAVYQASQFWSKNMPLGLALIAVGGLGLLKLKSRWWLMGFLLVAVVLGQFAQIPEHYFVRYPASNYLLGSVFYKIGETLNWADLYNAVRLPSTVALVFWLLIRPRIFAKPANAGFYLAAALLLWQSYHIYYFASGYLEPWAAVFLLLAVESLCEENTPVWYAPLFAGCALFFKETVVFLWPFFILAGISKIKSVREKWSYLALSGLAAIPFLVYYIARTQGGVWRKFATVPLTQAFTVPRIDNFEFRVLQQYGWAGLVTLLAFVIAGAYFVWRTKPLRVPVFILVAGALTQFFIFFIDEISQEATAYPRFHLLPTILLLAPVFAGFRNLTRFQTRALLVAACVGQSFGLYVFYEIFSRPAYAQSFSEGYTVPFHLPIRYLVRKAETEGLLRKGQTIILTPPSEKTRLNIFSLVYRDLVDYRWLLTKLPEQGGPCRCEAGQAYLLPTPQPMNLVTQFPHEPYKDDISRVPESCIESVKASCGRCVSADWPGTQPLGWLCVKQ